MVKRKRNKVEEAERIKKEAQEKLERERQERAAEADNESDDESMGGSQRRVRSVSRGLGVFASLDSVMSITSKPVHQ